MFDERENIGDVVNKGHDTTLTAWFKLNQEDKSANSLLYHDIPKFYVWDQRNKIWKKRKKSGAVVIGRIYFVNPQN